MDKEYLLRNLMITELGLFAIIIILIITFLPIFCGVLVAMIIGATGWMYFFTSMVVAMLIWFVLSLIWWF